MKTPRKIRREPDVGKIIDRTIVRLWDTIEELEELNPAELHFYRVAVFGSARVKAGDPEYLAVRDLATRLTGIGCDIVTGGGPGLMEAANEGAARSGTNGRRRTRSFGLTIAIPFEKANPYLDSVTAPPDLLFAPPSLRAHVAGVRDLPGRHRHGAGAHDGLAAHAGGLPDGAARRPDGGDVAGTDRLDAPGDGFTPARRRRRLEPRSHGRERRAGRRRD